MKSLSLVLLFLISHATISQTLIWEEQNTFSGDSRSEAVSFVIGDTAYVGTGRNDTDFYKDFYKYDPATNHWTQISDLPGDARYVFMDTRITHISVYQLGPKWRL